MDFAINWLVILGPVFVAYALAVWGFTNGNRTVALWMGVTGIAMLVLAMGLQIQQDIWKADASESKPTQIGTRTYLTMSFGAVLLNSPGPGQVTAWIRIKNTGPTPAYNAKGWQKFLRGLTGQDPFSEAGNFENEAILGPGQEFNLSSSLSLDASQLAAIKDKTLSFYVWGRVEYTDETKQLRYFIFKGSMNGDPDTVVVDGVRAEGWGLRPIPGGFDAN